MSKSADSVEFKELLPGDLMFWTGTYESGRDVPISHVMMYSGRENMTGKRIMFSATITAAAMASSARGVSVFDFKMPKADAGSPEKTKAEFIGFARTLLALRGLVPPSSADADADTAKKEAASTPAPNAAKQGSTKTGRKSKR